MKRNRLWNERTRLLLTLELAVVAPAAALIIFSALHLKSIQRDRSVEAAIQRDFYQVLAIADKHMGARAFDMVDDIRRELPPTESACTRTFNEVLERRKYAAHLFLYSPDHGLIFSSQPSRMDERDFRAEGEELQKMYDGWMKLGAYPELQKKFRDLAAKNKPPRFLEANWTARGEKRLYQNIVVFPILSPSGEQVALAGVVFDAEYLRDQFFPAMLDEVLNDNLTRGPDRNEYAHAAIMVHMKGESTPLAASKTWDGGTPEVERPMEAAFPGLTLAMKLQGTTVEALGQRFIRTSFIILAALSLLMAGGIYLTYRNVNKEMALARLKSDFVSNVSHELRTPLSLIRLYAETLEMGRLTSREKYQEYYCIIRKESERLTALINNILDFSRIEAGRKEYDFRETDIAELVRNTLDSYRYQIEQQGFTFEERIADDIPKITVDREAIARSLLNLVNNALKYSAGDKFLMVNLYRGNGSVKLEVVDHGIGIPRSEQPKIFEKFYRVGDPLVHNTKGSGLGLSLVRHIVRAHGGDISVESIPGQGSKFVIALPVDGGGQSASAASA